VLETADSFWKLVGKDRFPKLKDFALKLHSMFGNRYLCVVWEYIFNDEATQIWKHKSNGSETLDDSLHLSPSTLAGP